MWGRGYRWGLWAPAALAAIGCGDSIDLTSHWRTQDVVIDGANTEWQENLVEFEDHDISVGLTHDDRYLYIALFLGDRRTQAQVLTRGMTLWFDDTGSKQKRFGIRYPLGLEGVGREDPRHRGEPGPEFLQDLFARQPAEMEILREGTRQRSSCDESPIEVAARLYGAALVYEARVPLHEDALGIPSTADRRIAIGLETPKPLPSEEGRPAMRGGGRPGSGMGGGGGREAGGRRGPRRQGAVPPTPLQVWAVVELVDGDDAGG